MKQQTKNTIVMTAVIVGVLGLIVLIGAKDGGFADMSTASADLSKASQVAASLDALVGKPAPSFSLTDINGKEYSSENLKGKNVVLFFNEGLMCYPACWNQIAKFGSDARFTTDELIALSVVVDPKDEWRRAIAKMPELAAATTLFDDGGDVSRTFNVLKTPSSMHYGILPGHTYVVIDKEGVVRDIYDDPRMAIRNDEMFATITSFNQ